MCEQSLPGAVYPMVTPDYAASSGSPSIVTDAAANALTEPSMKNRQITTIGIPLKNPPVEKKVNYTGVIQAPDGYIPKSDGTLPDEAVWGAKRNRR